jgi:hypothetical protein
MEIQTDICREILYDFLDRWPGLLTRLFPNTVREVALFIQPGRRNARNRQFLPF